MLNGKKKYNFYIHIGENFFQKGKYDIFLGQIKKESVTSFVERRD